ncbi:hypothetical protein D3C87_232780 [compost metagenome]
MQPTPLVFIIAIILFMTPISRVLRSEIVYWSCLIASLLFPWIAYEVVRNELGTYDVNWFVSTITLTTLLLLYKLFDNYILRTRGRNLFIAYRGHHLGMKEGWLDLIFQFILIFLPLIWFFIGKVIL